MQELLNECYQWVQIFLVARSCQERMLYVGADRSKIKDEDSLNRYKILMEDLYSGKFVDYSLFRLSDILWRLCCSQRKEVYELISQTVTLIAMVSHNLLSPDGKYIHTIGSVNELKNLNAFDKNNGKNLKPFSELLSYLIYDENMFMNFHYIVQEYNILCKLEEMLFDSEYMLIAKDELLKFDDLSIKDMNEFLDLSYKRIQYGIETLKRLNNMYKLNSDYSCVIRGKVMQFIKFAEKELEQFKLFGVGYSGNNLYSVYARHLMTFISKYKIHAGLHETIKNWINYKNKEE